ncbi:hypothetical protein BCR43DRAFT_498484 [Syncephalastrum racemosum]|uniref:Uncharacterized protein n=1 Tax=Syncephalastrum racemosum TaxID=13706 RepID=A0A1X2H0Y5_SYNRA|nr:hypothetical protein BCR43DRAFT_498484 [Syncephalastrum racemosum]
MAATAPSPTVSKPTHNMLRDEVDDDDTTLASYLVPKKHCDQDALWSYQQQQQYGDWALYQQQHSYAQGYGYYMPSYYQYPPHYSPVQQPRSQHRSRASSRESLQINKSSSTPVPPSGRRRPSSTTLLKQQQQQQQKQHARREESPSPRPRTTMHPSNKHQPHSPHQHHHQQQHPHISRPSSSSSSTASSVTGGASDFSTGRRSSITSVSSNMSLRSEMSVNTKLSLSKRLRKVFSVSQLKGNKTTELGSHSNGSNTSLSTVNDDASSVVSAATTASCKGTNRRASFRRRSMQSLSNLFQKNNAMTVVEEEDDEEHSGDLRALRSGSSSHGGGRPASHGRRPPRIDTMQAIRQNASVPSPTPSNASSYRGQRHRMPSLTQQDSPSDASSDMEPPLPPPHVYGLPVMGSPRLRPAPSSSSTSLVSASTSTAVPSTTASAKKAGRLQFCPTIQVHETFSSSEYDRRCDNNATCQKLTPLLAMKIKQELNEFKLSEMEIHTESRQYTHFFL